METWTRESCDHKIMSTWNTRCATTGIEIWTEPAFVVPSPMPRRIFPVEMYVCFPSDELVLDADFYGFQLCGSYDL